MRLTNSHILLLIFIFFGSFTRVTGQNTTDKLYLFYEQAPATNFKKITGKSNQAYSLELSVGAPPINLTSRLKWIHNLYGKTINNQFEGLEKEYVDLASNLYDIQYGQIFIYSFNHPKWSLFAAPRIIIRSDFEKNELDNAIFSSGIVLANYNPDGKKRVTWSFGLAYSNDFNRNQLIPIAGFSYKSDKYFIEVTYPRVNVLYKPKKNIEWGLTSAITGGIFKTTDIKLSSESSSPFSRIINVSVGHTLNYLISDKLVINTSIGYAPVRNFSLLDNNYKTIQSSQTNLKPTAFFRTGISVRF